MKCVIVESPYSGNVEENVAYARKCMLDCLKRDEAPFLSHLLYPQVLDDLDPAERGRGIEAGLMWGLVSDKTVVYTDLGISPGMQMGIAHAEAHGRDVEYRHLL